MGLYKKLRKYVTGRRMVWPPQYRGGMELSEINVRDPFIVNCGDGYLMTGPFITTITAIRVRAWGGRARI